MRHILPALIAAAPLLAQAPIPATPAGQKLKAWLEAFNSGDAARIEKYVHENFAPELLKEIPADQRAKTYAGVRGRFGEQVLHWVELQDDHHLKAVLADKDQTIWFTQTIAVSPNAPNLISQFGGRGEREKPEKDPARKIERLPDAALAQDLDKYLQTRTVEDKFAGAVLIAKDGQPIFSKAYGMADRDKKIANTLDTKFNLGSMNKMLTSVAIAQLAQAGKLQFTDTIAKLLPDYPNKEVAAKVTVHHLLTHTSGLGNAFCEEWDKKKDSVRTVKDWFPFFVDEPLSFEPGAKFQYSNAGFVVLGAIIEKVSGKDYYAYIREKIYMPLGMKDSDSYPKTDVVPKMAIGYMRGEKPADPKLDNVSTRPFRGLPAGGGYSTVGDLLKFAEGLRSFKLINQEFTERIIGKKVDPAPGSPRGYAYGFEDNRQNGIRTVGHGGGARGINGELSIYWDSGYTVVVLANLDSPAASAIKNYIHERIQAK